MSPYLSPNEVTLELFKKNLAFAVLGFMGTMAAFQQRCRQSEQKGNLLNSFAK